MKLEAIALAACLVATSGCANLNSIYRTHSVRTGEIVLSDAKQRAILTNYESVPIMSEYDAATKKTTYSKKLGVLTRYCAEPSPDVFTVLSSSLAAAGNASLTQESREIAVNIASQISESGATIQRTQTIQTLREMMYRLCERYINGALTDESFEAQAARDHRIIVSILAIEQLTNAVRPEPIILKASSSAQAGADYTAINSELSKARDHQKKTADDLERKKLALQDAETALSEADGGGAAPPSAGDGAAEDGPSEGGSAQEAPAKAGAPATPDKPSKAELQAAVENRKSDVTVAEQKLADADKLVEKLLSLLNDPKPIEVAGFAGGKFGGTDFAPPAVTKQIADAISAIVKQNIEFDEVSLKCVSLMGPNSSPNLASKFCDDYLRSKNARAVADVVQTATSEEERSKLLKSFMDKF